MFSHCEVMSVGSLKWPRRDRKEPLKRLLFARLEGYDS